MNPQFKFRLQNQEPEQRRTIQPDFKTTTASTATMFQRSSQLQSNEYEGENMSSLHAKLHQEADKIRKWKIQTELDLKEKDKKLTTASSQIETMKKSMLELQLDNERLSSRMQEEIDNREEIMQKISSTREMCNLLKSAASKIEDRMLHCEIEKTELKYAGKEASQHLEELQVKFENLHLTSESNQKKLFQEVEKDRNEILEKEKQWSSKFEESAARADKFEADLKEKNEALSNLQTVLHEKSATINELNESICQFEKDNETLQENLHKREEEILTFQNEKQVLEVKLKQGEADINSLKYAHDHMCLQMTESCTKYEKDLLSAQENITNLETGITEEQNRLKSCQTELHEAHTKLEKLKSSNDILTKEKTEFEVKLDIQNFEIENLNSRLTENKEEIDRMNAEIDVLVKKLKVEDLNKVQLQNIKKELEADIHSLKLEKDELLKTVLDLETALESKENEVKYVLSKESEEREILQADVMSKDKELEDSRKQLKNLQELCDQVQESVVKKDSDLSDKTSNIGRLEQKLQDEKSLKQKCENELEQAKDDIEELKNKCEEEKKKGDELSNQIKDMEFENKEHGKSLTSQKKRFATLTKHNKELENELKSLKADLKIEMKKNAEKEKAVTSMREEIEKLQQTNQDLDQSKTEFEKDMEKLKEKCMRDIKASEEAITKAKEMQEMAKKEKENATALTECQLVEMMGTLDTYKQSSEKILAEKEAEVRSLRNKLETQKTLNSSERDELREENKQLSANMKCLSKEKEDMQKQLNDMAGAKESLENRINDLEKQVENTKQCSLDGFSKSPKFSSDSRSQLSQQMPIVASVSPQKQIPRTPKMPKTPKTPMQIKDDQSMLKTPQRSILKAPISMSKRRKVAFMADDPDLPSSSDDLMEVDVEDRDHLYEQSTPQVQSRTPRISSVLDRTSIMTPKRTPNHTLLNKVLRASTPLQKTPDISGAAGLSTTRDKLKDAESELQKSERQKTPNIRKVPPKKSKFFTTSPKDKTRIKDKTKMDKTGQLSWFDLDSVYGFGPED